LTGARVTSFDENSVVEAVFSGELRPGRDQKAGHEHVHVNDHDYV
jgi:hypothetical protein